MGAGEGGVENERDAQKQTVKKERIWCVESEEETRRQKKIPSERKEWKEEERDRGERVTYRRRENELEPVA